MLLRPQRGTDSTGRAPENRPAEAVILLDGAFHQAGGSLIDVRPRLPSGAGAGALLDLSGENCLDGGGEDIEANPESDEATPDLLLGGAARVRSIFQRCGSEYLQEMDSRGIEVAEEQRKALWRIRSSKTSVLGYHMWECVECGTKFTTYNACEDRHCRQCMEFKGDQWTAALRMLRICETSELDCFR